MHNLVYSDKFIRQLEDLSDDIKTLVYKKIALFKHNPKHPSLKTHKLHGVLSDYFSFSVNQQIRIVFEYGKGKDIYVLKIGSHDVYRK
jgi:mRNA-degrading endonuclease YafQ of YafQ-DinJ toxin-antitoxin module